MGGLTQQDVAALGGYQGPPPPTQFSSNDISSAGNPLGSTADLEARAARAPSQLVQGLQNQQQPQAQTQQPQNDPFAPILQPLYDRLKQVSPANPQPMAGGVKGFLTNFLTGGGEAMMRHVGMLTPEEERLQLTDRISAIEARRENWLNTQSEISFRQQQLAAGHRPLSPEQTKAIGHEELAGQIVPPDVIAAASAESSRQLSEKEKGLDRPTISLPLDSGTAKLAGVPDRFVGQNLSAADWKLIDARLSAQGYQKVDMGFDGKNGGIWIMDRGGNKINQITPVFESNRAIKALTAGQNTVYAYDPVKNETVLTTTGQAQAAGMQNIRSVKETDIRNDQHDIKVLNDITAKANQVYQSASAMTDTDMTSTLGVARYLSEHPNTTGDQLVASGVMGNISQPAKNYIMDILSLRESSMGLQKVLTGTARVNEVQLSALLRTLPSLEPDARTVRDKLQRFTQNITMLRQGIPRMPGMDVIPVQGSPTGNPGGAFDWNKYPTVKP